MNQARTYAGQPGCFVYGCLIATVLFCLVIGSVWFFGLRSMRSAVDQYTVESSEPLPVLAVDGATASAALDKLQQLRTAVQKGTPATIELSDREIQALISETTWRDRLHVTITGGEMSLNFSFPLGVLGQWSAASRLVGDISQRSLVGKIRGSFALKEGKPKLGFSELVLNNKVLEDLPRGHAAEWVVGAVAHAMADPEVQGAASPVVKRLREVVIRDGRLLISVGPRASDNNPAIK